MKAADIVSQLAAELPKHTDGFTNAVGISSIVPAGATALVTTSAAHGLVEGQNVAILGTSNPVQIDIATFVRVGAVATFETLQDHDLTLSERDIAAGGKLITISGANEAEFNGTFTLAGVPNRRKVQIDVTDAGPTTITGAPIVENGGVDLFNGFFTATGVTADAFTVTLSRSATLSAVVAGAAVQTSIRIAAVLDIVQYLQDVYTRQTVGEDHLVIQLGDVVVSKSRDELTDASRSNFGNRAHFPVLVQPFSVFIVQNVTGQTAAAPARDLIESEYVPAILKALERCPLNTGFSYTYGHATFVSHGVFAYSDDISQGKAVYAHEVSFEQLAQLAASDMFDPFTSVAMRDVGFTLTVDPGTGIDPMTAGVDLDEEPRA